ncbi:hypothetical protein CANCADRAFT_2118 [Tortispora caseinolytica NRRL Y-17796]|uniref:Trafficking protein particle complex subunit n=1 Tax=Tortispora caseinolytica NRRL Y-17796 TaxID=767744 RepID=A0A1E4TF42_9ASCO|nr:hypothetical protein CANCADRAFT_2118 [Tortispora caseinolytica NRRL Y-17796]
MAILSLYILNKSGGLVYQRDFTEKLNKLSANDYLVLAGTFHGIHVIASKISPVSHSSGIKSIDSSTFSLHCLQTPTGIKFLLVTDPGQSNAHLLLSKIYQLYADYVMKNPFHQLEMPIRSDQFNRQLTIYASST